MQHNALPMKKRIWMFSEEIIKREILFLYLTVLLLLGGCGWDRNSYIEDGAENFQKESNREIELLEVQEEKMWEPSYELTEDDLIRWDEVQETETEDYFIVQEIKEETGEKYPQIVMKEGKDILCGANYLNRCLRVCLILVIIRFFMQMVIISAFGMDRKGRG